MKQILIMACIVAPAYGSIYEDPEPELPEFYVVSHSIITDAQAYHFMVEFNRVPDFLSFDQFNRQRDSFQFNINTSNAPTPFHWVLDTDVLVRGPEIYLGQNIPVRNTDLPTNDPSSGGWGGAVGYAPYSLDDKTILFDVDLGLIDQDGAFSYALEAYYGFGQWNGIDIWGQVPEPGTLSLLTFGLLLFRGRYRDL